MIERQSIPQAEIPEIREEMERAESLRRSRIEAIKDAAGWGWIAATLAAITAMSSSEDPTVKNVGAAIFLSSMLAPGVFMAKDAVEDVVDKWRGKSLNSQEKIPHK